LAVDPRMQQTQQVASRCYVSLWTYAKFSNLDRQNRKLI
jgi:hypothetical protein